MPLTQPLDRLELLDSKDLPELCCQCIRESSSMVGGATSAISNATKMLCGLGHSLGFQMPEPKGVCSQG